MIEYIKIAVFFVLGIYLHERVSPGFLLIFFMSLVLVSIVKAAVKRKVNMNILLFMLAFTVGAVWAAYGMSDNVRDLSPYKGRYVSLTGRISEIPQQSDENVSYTVDVRSVIYKEEEVKVKDEILLTAPSGYEYGDTVTFTGFVNALPEKMNSSGSDYARYCKVKGIYFKLYSEDINYADTKIHDYSPYAVSTGIKNFISNVIDDNYSGDYNAIMKAVLTGNKKEFSPYFDEVLTDTVLKRYYYPAYLHVMLFMAVITFLLGALDKRKRDIATVFLLIIYAAANFGNTVFLRLTILLALIIFLKHRFGRVYYPDVLGMTAIIAGILKPLIFYDSGFVMSMLSCVMIYYFFDYVYAKLKFVKIKYIRRVITIGIICTIGLIPIAAYLYNNASLYAVFISVIMLPCVAVIVVLSTILIPLLALFHTAPIIHQAVSCMLFILKYVPIAAYKLHLTGFAIAKPGMLLFLVYLFGMVATVKYVKNKKKQAGMAIFVAAAFFASAAVCEISRLTNVEITFVNVGQGDGAFITAPHRFTVLIDGGGGNAYSPNYNPGETQYLAYLEAEGITKVDSAFVSHYHQDHVQGIIAAMENIKVRNLFLPDTMNGSEWRVALEKAAKENGTNVHYISEETLLTYNNGMTIRIIPPSKKTAISDDENDTTFVYRVEYAGFSALFTGDMSSFAEECMIDAGKAERADLLKVSHHGSATATGEAFLDIVKPKYAVISVGENNTYNLPKESVLERLGSTEIYRTDYNGDIKFIVNKNGKVNTDTFR